MKGFKNLLIVTFVGSTALVAVTFYLMHRPEKAAPEEVIVTTPDLMHRPEKAAPEEVIVTTPDGLNVDLDTAYLDCSHNGKEWYICASPEGWGTEKYCPAYSEYNESDLALVEWGEIGVPTPYSPCFTCPKAGISCDDHVKEVFTAANISEDQNWNLWDDGIRTCERLCEMNKEGESCSAAWYNGCRPGTSFCDFEDGINGICTPCPTDLRDCYKDGFVSSKWGKESCLQCQMHCKSVGASKVWVDGVAIPSQPVANAIQSSHQNATGALHDCSNLSLKSVSSCPGAKGKMCLVYFEYTTTDDHDATSLNAEPWQVSDNAEESGCIGVIAFDQDYYRPPWHEASELLIPYVYITEDEGLVLLDSKIGMDVKVEVNVFGAFCTYNVAVRVYGYRACNANLPCDDDSFCAFAWRGIGPDLYSEGECLLRCPEDPLDCYFNDEALIRFYDGDDDQNGTWIFDDDNDNVESCAKACDAGEADSNLMESKLTEFSFGEDRGYAGANTSTKKLVLAWLPRTAAILSMLGSLFIIVDTQRTPTKRAKVINKILCAASVFDMMGSFAMSFTTLPTQQEDYIHGSHGNDQTCKAQGFFIQMGTIACLMGVSLAFYYNFTIKQGWSEARMKRMHILHYLLVTPITIGFAFACAGIPFYDNVLVWCNNSAKWWPEIPIVLALFHATAIMVDVIYTVHQQEMATSRYTGGSRKMSKMVFHQAIFFVGAFYITWIPYLVLQYMLSSGKGYDEYGLTLAASTMCALQGFWNFIVYARPRNYLTRKALSRMVSVTLSGIASGVNSFCKKVKRRISSEWDKEKEGTFQAEITTPNHLEANQSGIAESEFVPFELPEAGEVDESEVGATVPQDSLPLDAVTEFAPFGILEVGAEADELAIGESAGTRNGECNSTSLVEEPSAISAVNEPADSKKHSRFRATLMNLRNRFSLANSYEGRSTSAGAGLEPEDDDDSDGTIDIDTLFEMLLAG